MVPLIDKINKQRKRWFFASFFVFFSLVSLIFGWDWLYEFHNPSLWLIIISLLMIVCINWWFWTMRVIFQLIKYQQDEYTIIHEMIKEIKELHEQIKILDIDKEL